MLFIWKLSKTQYTFLSICCFQGNNLRSVVTACLLLVHRGVQVSVENVDHLTTRTDSQKTIEIVFVKQSGLTKIEWIVVMRKKIVSKALEIYKKKNI